MEERFKRIFQEWAEHYDSTVFNSKGEYKEVFRNYKGILLEMMDAIPKHASTVLDIGTGTGNLLRLLQEKGYRAVGIEPSKEMREEALRKYPELNILDGHFLDLPGGKYDAIVNSYAFHHLTYQKKREALGAMNDRLNKDGAIIIADTMFSSVKEKRRILSDVKASNFLGLLNDLNTEYYEILDEILLLFRELNFAIEVENMNEFVWIIKAYKN